MRTDEIERVRGALDEFVAEVFAPLVRKDQRGKGGLYLQGLMLEGRRKSMQPMGARLGVDHQQLQQFVSSSPWPVEPVRRLLAHKAVDLLAPVAWVVDDTGFPKDGPASPGVARQYSGTLGKVGNVQIGVSVHAVTDAGSCPLDWRLFLPRSWDDTSCDTTEEAEQIRRRRRRAQIPDEVRHRPKWQLALDMLDELAAWDLVPPVVVADAGYGDNGFFRTGLTQRGIGYVVAVKSELSVHPVDAVVEEPVYSGRGRPRKRGYLTDPVQARTLALGLPDDEFRTVSWRHGTKGTMTSRFTTVRVRPANRNLPREADGTLSACWLLVEWPDGAPEPTDYWLSTLDEDTSIEELVRWAKIRWRIEHDYRELKHGLGLDHFEGRTWLGWHHHVTLVTAAHLFVTGQRVAGDPDPKAPEAG
ncbi:IS701 family transposase [Corynebacterium sp. YIM 101645]|uniref:IS701 family transposase n=1 Tax=Corynebacterium lemuris TaxID=1859292 RepID=A0ABT2G0H7_9CORY|nr:IS701 family transposase [Corynebacterium lemuris]MCS5481003.1 IS701 family transposase [Corynebacterium lemuris]